jgi:hypothetical protein
LPGLTRQSIFFEERILRRVMDTRVKPAYDAVFTNALTQTNHPADIAGIGSAVTDLIFSIAKREVTFFSDTAPISFL